VSAPTIRPFTEADVPAVAAMRRAVFRTTRCKSPMELEAYFRLIFFANPWRRDGPASLVCDLDGRITGFIGFIPRRMMFRSRPIDVVVCTQLMVDPTSRGASGLTLLRRLLDGPQELAIADAGADDARRIWAGLGGDVASLYSLVWIRPLRPVRHAAAMLGDRLGVRIARRLARPALSAADALVQRFRAGSTSAAPRRRPAGTTEPLDVEFVATHLAGSLAWRSLYPLYDAQSLAWLLDRAREAARAGPLRAVMVRDGHGELAGWYIFYEEQDGVSRVLQLCATDAASEAVIGHLLHDAWRGGSVAVRGQLAPPLLRALTAAGCAFQRGGPWALVHSRDPDIRNAIARGDAWITGLDGERWLSF
jgi:hypothetical protein